MEWWSLSVFWFCKAFQRRSGHLVVVGDEPVVTKWLFLHRGYVWHYSWGWDVNKCLFSSGRKLTTSKQRYLQSPALRNQCVYRTYVQDSGKHVSIYSQVDTHGGIDSSVTISSDCILMVSEVDQTLLVLLMLFLEKLTQSCKYPGGSSWRHRKEFMSKWVTC